MRNFKSFGSVLLFYVTFLPLISKAGVNINDTVYLNALENLEAMLDRSKPLSFKRAVFLTENAFLDNKSAYQEFSTQIENLALLANSWSKSNPPVNYPYQDSLEMNKSLGIYMVMKDTIKLKLSNNEIYGLLPFSYDFEDFDGRKDWTKMFVTKLLKTNSGNCHSLPYLYKILSEELNLSNSWLSFAPYHIYIRNNCQGIGWYNTELTSGQFPVDAWVMASGYVPVDAIRSGIYMDTLSNEQAVANCALDLAKGYERKYGNYTDSFLVKCCDLTLKYHSNNINAIIYKAETLKKMYLIYQKENPAFASTIYQDMEKLYVQALDLGYKEMPERMYKEWILSVVDQKDKYNNKNIKKVLNQKLK